ncbi:cellulose biosynthesis protein BcsG [Providencia burhodogranariea]|uniref:Cellulose biosynthesis protein BcsG n=1 Tax=Providencia burhodogranariea DSM 19968 TaxID=1141662 RepID=K8W989_9GAMM|nr:cellulose biosynthesis protein BcsG [Providencia burhodogranariea]EKT57238.1 hypothetical protein OOA_15270 [Providencia burhodogranariea DSM 19968]
MSSTSPIYKNKSPQSHYYYGLKGWNFYFILKFILLWYGYLNFNTFENLLFIAYLLLPLPWKKLSQLRYFIAIPIGLALLYHDSWLPSIQSIWEQKNQLADFSSNYVYELLLRFINLKMIAAGFILFVIYYFSANWLRYSTFVIAGILWLNISSIIDLPTISANASSQTVSQDKSATTTKSLVEPSQSQAPSNEALNDWLEQFYQYESKRSTAFPSSLPQEAQPFDLLMINICSLSWGDLDEVKLADHPIWKRFDILFDNFNSATSYSGPASIRLLRASCGQPSHPNVYNTPDKQCYLLDNLANLGFKEYLLMDHKGETGNYLSDLRNYAGLKAPLESHDDISHQIIAFDGTPIYNDQAILQKWLKTVSTANDQRTATFFNLIPLHDGNRNVGDNKVSDYQQNTKVLLDQLNSFFDELEQSGRKVMVVVAPEHGAALTGDKLQISGLRDIPSPVITKIPVGIKFIGLTSTHPVKEIIVSQPSSYLALSELIARAVDGKIFSSDNVDWAKYTENLPITAHVAENSNSIVIEYQGKSYIRINKGKWIPYPNQP